MVIDEWQKLPTTAPWLPPGGSWIFWQSALRNRLAKKTDEGWRYLKVLDFSVEWYDLGTNFIQPACTDALRKRANNIRPYSPGGELPSFIAPAPISNLRHPSSVNIVGSEEPPILPASPRGKPRGGSRQLSPFNRVLSASNVTGGRLPPLQGWKILCANKNFQPSTFPVPICAYWLPLVRGEPIGFESGITCSRDLRRPEPCRLRCRCTSRSSW